MFFLIIPSNQKKQDEELETIKAEMDRYTFQTCYVVPSTPSVCSSNVNGILSNLFLFRAKCEQKDTERRMRVELDR